MTRPEALQHAKDWVEAMDNQFYDPDDCGCVPLHYALRTEYLGSKTVAVFTIILWKSVAPVDIPLTFVTQGNASQPDIVVQGHAPNSMVNTTNNPSCPYEGHETPDLTLYNAHLGGTPGQLQLEADISSPPTTMENKWTCQTYGGSDTGPWKGPVLNYSQNMQYSAPLFHIKLPAVVGAEDTVTVPQPLGERKLHVKIIQLGSQ